MFLGMEAIVVSPAMQRLLAVVERVAKTGATVLIQGESGSGKELVARAVHHFSLRCAKPWVDVSCAALPEHLVESELFGYEKGAFSSADAPKPGLFELAHGGTLFLDEVGELEPRMQIKLLRVLDGTPYYRLGGVRKVGVDVRIIAATNQDLDSLVASGRFRSDLYHRLCQVNLRVPALRERQEDIVPMALYFLEQLKPSAWFSESAVNILRRYSWPGNIRELRNVVTKVAVLASGDELTAEEIAPEISRRQPNRETPEPGVPENDNLDGVERRMIMKVLAQTNGHQAQAAELLGISRRTLSRKLKIYETEPSNRSFVS